jgi:hypothetical protein
MESVTIFHATSQIIRVILTYEVDRCKAMAPTYLPTTFPQKKGGGTAVILQI